MAEVVLAAEVGRPTGSRAVRRLRREGKIPGVIYGHGTDPLPVAIVARELRVALNSEAGANQLLSLDTGSGTYLALAREMQRHPIAQTVTHVDFVIVRRDEVISADVPVVLIGEATRGPPRRRPGRPADVHARHQRPADRHPRRARSRHQRRSPSAAPSGSPTWRCPTGSPPTSTPRPPSPSASPRGSSPTRRGGRRRGGRGGRRRRRVRRGRLGRGGAAKRARPCAAPSPGPSAGAHRRTCWSSGWATPEPSSPGAAQRRVRRRRAAGDAPRGLAARREGRAGPHGRRWPSLASARRPGRAHDVHERLGRGRARLAARFGIDEPSSIVIVHDELDLPPGTVRLKAGGGLAGHNGLRSIAVASAHDRLPARAHRCREAAERGPGRGARPAPAAQGGPRRSSTPRWRRRPTPSSASWPTASTPPCCGATRCPA